jgi:hypothetical protein
MLQRNGRASLMYHTNAFAALLLAAVVLGGIVTVGIWTGATTLDTSGFHPASAVVLGSLIFAFAFWTMRRSVRAQSTWPWSHPTFSNQLYFWIFAVFCMAIFGFAAWVHGDAIRLRDLLMGWIITGAALARIAQYRGLPSPE